MGDNSYNHQEIIDDMIFINISVTFWGQRVSGGCRGVLGIPKWSLKGPGESSWALDYYVSDYHDNGVNTPRYDDDDDNQIMMFTPREGRFTRSGIEEVDEIEVFKGEENKVGWLMF